MKKVICLAVSLICLSNASAEGMAKLRLNISGQTKGSHAYLCVYGLGCINMHAATAQRKAYPILTGQVANMRKLILANGESMQIYSQPIPSSCKARVGEDRNVVISGTLIMHSSVPYLSNVRCSIS